MEADSHPRIFHEYTNKPGWDGHIRVFVALLFVDGRCESSVDGGSTGYFRQSTKFRREA